MAFRYSHMPFFLLSLPFKKIVNILYQFGKVFFYLWTLSGRVYGELYLLIPG